MAVLCSYNLGIARPATAEIWHYFGSIINTVVTVMLSIYTPYIIKTMSYLSCNKSVFMLVLVTDAHHRFSSQLIERAISSKLKTRIIPLRYSAKHYHHTPKEHTYY